MVRGSCFDDIHGSGVLLSEYKENLEGNMTTKQLRRLSRGKLLQLLIGQMEENQRLRRELDNRQLIVENAGSLAEAALKLSGIFEAADTAARVYLDSLGREAVS